MSCIWRCNGCNALIQDCDGADECPYCGDIKPLSKSYWQDPDDHGDYLFHKQRDEEAEDHDD